MTRLAMGNCIVVHHARKAKGKS